MNTRRWPSGIAVAICEPLLAQNRQAGRKYAIAFSCTPDRKKADIAQQVIPCAALQTLCGQPASQPARRQSLIWPSQRPTGNRPHLEVASLRVDRATLLRCAAARRNETRNFAGSIVKCPFTGFARCPSLPPGIGVS